MEHHRISEHLRLERINISMAPVVFESIDRDRDYLRKWLPFVDYTLDVSDTEKFIKSISHESSNRDDIYCIWYKEEFAGLVGYKDIDRVNRKTEIGYWLVKGMQGKGIITACVETLVKFAFRKMKMNRVQIKVALGNSKSEAVPIRLGFTEEGVERAGEFHSGRFLDLKVYSLLASD